MLNRQEQLSDMHTDETRIKLAQITIRGYKSIAYDQPVSLQLTDLTLLIGANGAGKSNIVSFFKLLGFMMNGGLQLYVEKEGTSHALLHYGAKITPKISAELVYENAHFTDTYSFSLTDSSGGRLILSDEQLLCLEKAKHTSPYAVRLNPNFRESALIDSQDNKASVVKKMLLRTKYYQFHDSSSNGPLRQASPADTPHYLQTKADNLAAFLRYLQTAHPSSFRRIEEYVRFVVPSFRAFYLVPTNNFVSLKWYDNSGQDYVLTADQLSDGSIRFIALATLLLQPKETMPRVIILDEPELGLHPMAIDNLAYLLEEASSKAQIIVSTQSKDLIDHFPPNNVVVVEMDEDTHATTAQQLSEDALSTWLEDYSLSELWDKNILGGRP